MITITDQEGERWCKLIKDISGIVLSSTALRSLKYRFTPLMKQLSCKTLPELYQKVSRDKSLYELLINTFTINETSFFRDLSPYKVLMNHRLIPLRKKLQENRQNGKKFRIWSAASSTGQEAYSLAITAKEQLGESYFKQVEILGTDISSEVVEKAQKGCYTSFETRRGLSSQQLFKHFTMQEDTWTINSDLKSITHFEQFNLHSPFPPRFGTFDVIFCRYVAMYFDEQDRKILFEKLSRILQPDGFLIIGGTEFLKKDETKFFKKSILENTPVYFLNS